jgi:MFS family permease
MAFVVIFATRLGASAFEIALLTAGPAVFNLLFSLPAGRWMEGRALVPVTFWSAVWHRLGFLILVPLPWLFSDRVQVWVIVLLILLMSIPGTILAIGFNAMFAEAVPPEWRAEVVGKRNAIVAISLTVTTLISGQVLDRVDYPLNYVIVFAVGALGAALSTYYVGKVRLIPVRASQAAGHDRQIQPANLDVAPASQKAPPRQRRIGLKLKQMLYLDRLPAAFSLLMLAYLLFYAFQYLGIPLFPLAQVRELELSDGVISLGSSLFYGVMFLVSLRMVDINTRLGHKRTLALGATIFAAYPLLLGLAQGPALFWVASFVGGGAWAITNAGLTNRLMEKAPENQRPAGMALHNLVLNLGILLGSLTAPLLSEWVGLQTALLVVAALRLLAGIIFWIIG